MFVGNALFLNGEPEPDAEALAMLERRAVAIERVPIVAAEGDGTAMAGLRLSDGRLAPVKKAGIFATPEAGRIDAKDVLIDPVSLKDPAYVAVRHHFMRPPTGRLD